MKRTLDRYKEVRDLYTIIRTLSVGLTLDETKRGNPTSFFEDGMRSVPSFRVTHRLTFIRSVTLFNQILQ